MQIVGLNSLVTKKVQENFSIPIEVQEAVRPLIEKIGTKRKWMIYTAAVLEPLGKPEDEVRAMVGRVADTDSRERFKELLAAIANESESILSDLSGGRNQVESHRSLGDNIGSPGNRTAVAKVIKRSDR